MLKIDWWNINLPRKLSDFLSWVGDEQSESRVILRDYIFKESYSNVIDIGCGAAIDYSIFHEFGINYRGVDTCKFLIELNEKKNVPMIHSLVQDIPDDDTEFCYARHVLEHQESFKPMLNEMCRIARRGIAIIFFLRPGTVHEIKRINGTFENTYKLEDIELVLNHHPKIQSFEWQNIGKSECLLKVRMKCY